jgi:hypothetical protein
VKDKQQKKQKKERNECEYRHKQPRKQKTEESSRELGRGGEVGGTKRISWN